MPTGAEPQWPIILSSESTDRQYAESVIATRHWQSQPLNLLQRWASSRNQVGLAFREWMSGSFGTFAEKPGQNERLFAEGSEAHKSEARLQACYDLVCVQMTATSERYREVLTYLLWLETFKEAGLSLSAGFETPPAPNQPAVRWLDVGAKNWAYLPAIAVFLESLGANPSTIMQSEESPGLDFENIEAIQPASFLINGVELDGFRRYQDFHTRRDYALAFTQSIPAATYHVQNILEWQEPADIISHFLPFVFVEPHLAWGLPLSRFEPDRILQHTVSLLNPGGSLLLVNQGETEAEAQQVLLASLPANSLATITSIGVLPSPFLNYQHARYGFLCVKAE